MRPVLTTLFALLLLTFTAAPAFAADIVDNKPFDALLKKYVNKKGMVDYAGLKASDKDKAALDAYVDAIGSAKVSGGVSTKLAFYINAYNAIVIKSIVDRYPIESVMKVEGFFKSTKHTVAGKSLTLDQLENDIIRKEFSEPRIHFVLVCGAQSCPRLQRRAASGNSLNGLLESAAKEFIPKATKIDGNTVTTSELFNWFKDDFVKAEGSVGKFLAKYLPKHKEVLISDAASFKFSTYSWKLNAQ